MGVFCNPESAQSDMDEEEDLIVDISGDDSPAVGRPKRLGRSSGSQDVREDDLEDSNQENIDHSSAKKKQKKKEVILAPTVEVAEEASKGGKQAPKRGKSHPEGLKTH